MCVGVCEYYSFNHNVWCVFIFVGASHEDAAADVIMQPDTVAALSEIVQCVVASLAKRSGLRLRARDERRETK